jgi:hypothetical protein
MLSRGRDASLAGRTHARNPLPRLGFAAYIVAHILIPRGLLSRYPIKNKRPHEQV